MARKPLRVGTVIVFLLAGPLAGEALAVLPVFEQPGWPALTQEQRTILAPLEKEWGQMDAFRRKKWLGIAQRYSAMTPLEQASIQRNMREWARLAPEERKIAREKYKSLQKIAPEERQVVKQKWGEYATLSETEKERLRQQVPERPKIKTPAKPPAPNPTEKRVGAPEVPEPRSPLSPRKSPQSLLAPRLPVDNAVQEEATPPPPPVAPPTE